MKRIAFLFTVVFLLNTVIVNSSEPIKINTPHNEFELLKTGQKRINIPDKPEPVFNSGGSDSISVSTWYNIVDQAGAIEVAFPSLFPDSQVVFLGNIDGQLTNVHSFRHSVGQILDPSDFHFNQSPTKMIPKNASYTVDSVRIHFAYHKPIDSVVYAVDSIWWDTTVYAFSIDQMYPDSIEFMMDTSWNYSYNDTSAGYTDSSAKESFDIYFYDYSGGDVHNPVVTTLSVWPLYTRYEFDMNGDTVVAEDIPSDSLIYNNTMYFDELIDVIEHKRKVVDQLIVQFYKDENSFGSPRIIRSSFEGSGVETAFTPANHNRVLGARFNFETVIDLTDEHVYVDEVITITLPVNLTSNPDRNLFAVTFSYFPDFDYNFGDTLYAEIDNVEIANPINHFRPAFYGMTKGQLTSFNHGLFIHKQNQYYTDDSWRNFYIPGNAFTNNELGMYVDFHVTSTFKDPTFIAELTDNGYGLGNAYPNPAASDEVINIEFAIGNSELVTIDVYNIVGQKVKTITNEVYDSGNHTVTFSVNDLSPGIYLYNMNAGNFSKTEKLNIK